MWFFGKKWQIFVFFLLFSFLPVWGQEGEPALESEDTSPPPLSPLSEGLLLESPSILAPPHGLSSEEVVSVAEAVAETGDRQADVPHDKDIQATEIKTIAGAAPQEVLKTYIPIQQLIWNDADTLISYLEQDVVYLVDSTSHAIVGAVEFPGVLDYSMFMEEDGVIHIIAGSDDGTIAVWDIPYKPSEEMQPSQEFEPHFMDSVADSLDERGVDLLALNSSFNSRKRFQSAFQDVG